MPTPGPMNPLQIQLYTGSAAGRRARFDRSPITFGRDPGNLLVVEDAIVSRRHGEIRFENGTWVLANFSENGTRLNRKNVTDKPLPIKSGDEVFVSGKLLFNISIEAVEGVPIGDQPLSAVVDSEAAAAAPKRKTKLWLGIGGYMVLMLLVIIFLSTLKKDGPADEDRVPELTKDQIASSVMKPLKREPKSDVLYREAVTEATRLFHRRESSIGGLFEAHRKFQTALTYTGRDDFSFPAEDTDAQFQYLQVQKELIDKVAEAYADACNRLNRGDNEGAYRGFDTVKSIYPDGNSNFYANVQAKQNLSAKRLGKKKLKNT